MKFLAEINVALFLFVVSFFFSVMHSFDDTREAKNISVFLSNLSLWVENKSGKSFIEGHRFVLCHSENIITFLDHILSSVPEESW